MDEQDISIKYSIEEFEHSNTTETDLFELNKLIDENNDETNNENYDLLITQMINYQYNYTIKDLLLICDYYGFSKRLKNCKLNKEEIIKVLVEFEANPENSKIVFKRQNMWFYINELKSDKFMKKFVLW